MNQKINGTLHKHYKKYIEVCFYTQWGIEERESEEIRTS